MAARFHNPVDVRFGSGVSASLAELVGDRSCVVLTFAEAGHLGLLSPTVESLGGRLLGVLDQVPANPDVQDLETIWQAFIHLDQPPQVVVALGGGSVIDTAKAICTASSAQSFHQMMNHLTQGLAVEERLTCELVAVPTTAGTGSEVTPWATIWDKAAQKKYSLQGPALWPVRALIDPRLSQGCPASVTLSSGLDALSHALEALWNRHHNPVSDAMAVEAAKTILRVLPVLMTDLGNLGLRTEMARAALLAGLAFSNTKTALAHAISYDLTLRLGLAHGLACSFCLPAVLERALGVEASRDNCLAAIFGDPLEQAATRLRAFLNQLGVETSFVAYGYDAAAEAALLDQAIMSPRGQNFLGPSGSLARSGR
jgi:phosphonate metabolism-associated iron-containing alcohol dehydrogenase